MLKKIESILTRIVNKQQNFRRFFVHNYLTRPYYDIIIIDSIYPLPLSTFRFIEFNYYLSYFKEAIVYTTGSSLKYLHVYEDIESIVTEHIKRFSDYNGKVVVFDENRNLRGKLVYTVFLHQTYLLLPIIEKNKLPFVFTLYPGGGFAMYDATSDEYLRKLFNSIFFKKVIVTQKIVLDYLLQNGFCSSDKIELIYGVVMPFEELSYKKRQNKQLPVKEGALNICFVANKYMKQGIDKGYDTFIAVVKRFNTCQSDIKFHVVGTFSEDDIDVSNCNNIVFYGLQKTDFFPAFYSEMDIIISPNVPHVLGKGAFDGFPTGSCVEAGLMGVALFCSDTLGQNIYFTHQEDIIIIKNETSDICNYIMHYCCNRGELNELAEKGRKKIEKLFSLEAQMAPRIDILKEVMSTPA